MRLGGPIFADYSDPEQWIYELKKLGFGAAYCPEIENNNDMEEYVKIANKADIVIAEVGAWSNPLSKNEIERREAIRKCQEQLSLADKIGARCCVNISGSRGDKWDGPHSDNLTTDTFDMIVETVREIIDAVRPTRTYYTLEPMPWMYPDSADSYLNLISAIDRTSFAVHFDPVNLIYSPQRYFNNGEIIEEFIKKLGPYIKSCHAKDIILHDQLTIHLDEVLPGYGNLNYTVLLKYLNKLDINMPIMIEHINSEEECRIASAYIRSKAKELGIELKC